MRRILVLAALAIFAVTAFSAVPASACDGKTSAASGKHHHKHHTKPTPAKTS